MQEEIELFDLIVKKLETKDKYFFNTEKINMPLTYIFHFYRKYFFSQVEMITCQSINLLSNQRRLEIFSRNLCLTDLTKYEEDKKLFSVIFSFDKIEQIFTYLLELKTFCIKLSAFETKVPLIIYLLKLFFQSYCFDGNKIDRLLNILCK
jgi:hypothetical protein